MYPLNILWSHKKSFTQSHMPYSQVCFNNEFIWMQLTTYWATWFTFMSSHNSLWNAFTFTSCYRATPSLDVNIMQIFLQCQVLSLSTGENFFLIKTFIFYPNSNAKNFQKPFFVCFPEKNNDLTIISKFLSSDPSECVRPYIFHPFHHPFTLTSLVSTFPASFFTFKNTNDIIKTFFYITQKQNIPIAFKTVNIS